MKEYKKHNVPIEIEYIETQNGKFVGVLSKDSPLHDYYSIVVQANSLEELTQEVYKHMRIMSDFERDQRLKFYRQGIQFGPWGGGSIIKSWWFCIFGMHFSFRYGKKNMKGGWYVPFTKLNISFTNYWRVKWD